MKFKFEKVQARRATAIENWQSWSWQMRSALKGEKDFAEYFELSEDELRGFRDGAKLFRFQTTPYYASLADSKNAYDPIRKIMLPSARELHDPVQSQLDPLGENKNRPVDRIVHRYSDRALFLVTDQCSVYCRYCTRKHFTAKDGAAIKKDSYIEALDYIRDHKGIREVLLSGGDPLTLSDSKLDRILSDLRAIDHVEIIRIGTRMPVVNPMRITEDLVRILRQQGPVYMMVHFNHPREITFEAAEALEKMVDHGLPTFNQMVLLNGVNNSAPIVQALSRRLIYLRVKPYYMFQCDPSQGTDHLRTSVEESRRIQRELWGHLSGLAMPNLSLDLPDGGGKVGIVPDFNEVIEGNRHSFTGWDGVQATYVSPANSISPIDEEVYRAEWQELQGAKS